MYFRPPGSILSAFLVRHIKNISGPCEADLLEIGIGDGRLGRRIGGYFKNYFGIDVKFEEVRMAVRSLGCLDANYLVGNSEAAPFSRNSFDALFYAFSWHYMNDFNLALREARRILRPGGTATIIEPTEQNQKWRSPRLNRNSGQFDQAYYENKIRRIKSGEEAIKSQNELEVVESRNLSRSNKLHILRA